MSLQSFKVDCCYLLVNMQVFGKLKLVRTSKATSQDQYIRGSQWGVGFYGYRLKFWLFYGYRLIFFSYG